MDGRTDGQTDDEQQAIRKAKLKGHTDRWKVSKNNTSAWIVAWTFPLKKFTPTAAEMRLA